MIGLETVVEEKGACEIVLRNWNFLVLIFFKKKIPEMNNLFRMQSLRRYATNKMIRKMESHAGVQTAKPQKNIHSLASIADPYIPSLFRQQMEPIYSRTGIFQLFQILKKFFNHYMGYYFVYSKLKEKAKNVEPEKQLFLDVMNAYSKHHMGFLNRNCTDKVIHEMKQEVRQGKMKLLQNLSIENAKLIYIVSPNLKEINSKVLFVQKTIQFDIKYTLQQEEKKETIYAVFERDLSDSLDQWKYAGVVDVNAKYNGAESAMQLILPQKH